MTVFQCKSCGKASQDETKLCAPEKKEGFPVLCNTCGKPAQQKEDVCNPVDAD